MKKSCLITISFFVIPLTLYYFLFHIKLEFPVDLFFALPAAIGMFIALVLIVNTAIRRQELRLVEYAHERRELEDGARVAICGTIHPSGLAPLKSPFTQKDCVAYSYKVYSNQGEDEITEYSGCRLIPSMITSTHRSVGLLGWPNLKNFKQQLENDTVLDNGWNSQRALHNRQNADESLGGGASNLPRGHRHRKRDV